LRCKQYRYNNCVVNNLKKIYIYLSGEGDIANGDIANGDIANGDIANGGYSKWGI